MTDPHRYDGDSSCDDDPSHNFISQLPKVELHAHLNGCIREATLFELAQERGVTLNTHHFGQQHQQKNAMYNVRPRSLQDCFDMFAEIPSCVNDLDALQRITREALEDMASQSVVYFELRSTPKRLLHSYKDRIPKIMTKRDYIETIISVLNEIQAQEEERYQEELKRLSSQIGNHTSTPLHNLPRLPMVCRFIVAIDRSQSLDEATENVHLAIELSRQQESLVVGIDLGGNPTKRDFGGFCALFQEARDAGLFVTVHCAEIPCGNDYDDDDDTSPPSHERARQEAEDILAFRPERLGHALLLPSYLQHKLERLVIPIETCPTSNVMTLELNHLADGNVLHALQQHHPALQRWLDQNHPVVICTDDPGVFDTNATQELVLFQRAFQLNDTQLARLVYKSMDYAFCNDTIRTSIQERMSKRIEILLGQEEFKWDKP